MPTQKSPSGTDSSDLFQTQVPVLDARKLKPHKARDDLKCIGRKSLQATICSIQASSTLIGTVSKVGVSTNTTVLTSGFGALTQSTGTTVHIYLDFFLPDTPVREIELNKLVNLNKAVHKWWSL